eukprot:CAMPEP_0171461500 /NCGR_PEP_ID=MMETSP0945-20130129/5923_1 /TAXON_ID=109269 /ORGANISM="Vaucheria litorea, Strain CCMP2940" /LENGTH=259 /DNA_ID=CAMNT_0011987859 /DNA_START=134 /DNA_END=913 /DNA_ORIENTATION=+
MSVIVGGGRIGKALYEMGGKVDTIVGRNDAIPEAGEGPIYVCTRNDQLDNVIERTPPSRRKDLVFLQNGILRGFLEERGLGSNTQGMIYFAVSKIGEKPIDGITEANPKGLTACTGQWASAMKERLAKWNLSCHILGSEEYYALAFEKHVWICAFNIVGVKYSTSVGEVESKYGEEVRALISELLSATSEFYGIRFNEGALERLCAYARSVAHYPTAIKEWSWRNGFYWDLSKRCLSEGKPDPTPLHSDLVLSTGIAPE